MEEVLTVYTRPYDERVHRSAWTKPASSWWANPCAAADAPGQPESTTMSTRDKGPAIFYGLRAAGGNAKWK